MDTLARLRSHGLKATPQRLALYEAVLATRRHPTADEVLSAVRPQHPAISRNTVYTGLEALVAGGLVRRLADTNGVFRYDATTRPHLHLVCDGCGQLADLEGAYGTQLLGLASLAAGAVGFLHRDQDLFVYGTCAACRAKKGMHP